MMNSNILFLIMISIFIFYVGFIWIRYGVQKSISDSYYRLPRKYHLLFSGFCFTFSYLAIMIGLTPLMYIAGSFIMLVGASPAFKQDKVVKFLHMFGAYGGVLFSQLSIIHDYGMWYISVLFIIIAGLLYLLKVDNKVWWVEIVAFGSICVVLGVNL